MMGGGGQNLIYTLRWITFNCDIDDVMGSSPHIANYFRQLGDVLSTIRGCDIHNWGTSSLIFENGLGWRL